MSRFSLFALTSIFCLSIGSSPAFGAPPSKSSLMRTCSGFYTGAGVLQNVSGDSVFYNPIQVSITARGKISGEGRRTRYLLSATDTSVVRLTGKISRVVRSRKSITCKLNASTSDGAVFKLQLVRSTFGGFVAKNIGGTGQLGDLRGQVALVGE